VKKHSSLKKDPMFQYTNVYEEKFLRKQILKELPLGSSFNDVEIYCRNNFQGKRMKEYDLARSQLRDIKETKYISHRIKKSGTFPVGSSWTDVIFFFDNNEKFSRLLINKYGVWL
jgi:hypothetical protein